MNGAFISQVSRQGFWMVVHPVPAAHVGEFSVPVTASDSQQSSVLSRCAVSRQQQRRLPGGMEDRSHERLDIQWLVEARDSRAHRQGLRRCNAPRRAQPLLAVRAYLVRHRRLRRQTGCFAHTSTIQRLAENQFERTNSGSMWTTLGSIREESCLIRCPLNRWWFSQAIFRVLIEPRLDSFLDLPWGDRSSVLILSSEFYDSPLGGSSLRAQPRRCEHASAGPVFRIGSALPISSKNADRGARTLCSVQIAGGAR